MSRTMDTLPDYLKTYCIEHDTSKYTSRDHAAWRYIMRRALPFFRKHAVRGYEAGLAATGIRIDRIPHIDDIDRALRNFGWGAVPVCGFIPPWAFLEFQARRILPIATDMRSVDHIAYTPAPDIVHEAAGHAPILPDQDYRDYLAHYAQLGTKAIYSKHDLNLYEAIRYLSDIKEKPESTKEQISEAEKRLAVAVRDFTYVSEAARVARMSWWTAEYGLAGSLKEPKIYGAGLLSSVGESQDAMTNAVRKIPFSISCIDYSYDITEPQPQLFVAEDMQHLHNVLDEFDETLAYRVGGTAALQRALESEAVTTLVLNSGIAVSGILVTGELVEDVPVFIKYQGPAQLSHKGSQIPDQGPERHPEGFSSPIGRWADFPDRAPQTFSDSELRQSFGLSEGQSVRLKFTSGIIVSGTPIRIMRHEGILQLITFQNCSVRWGDRILFDPSWGEFDMLVGDQIVSVYGGPADRENYGEHEIANASTTPGRESPYTEGEWQLFEFYQKVRELRKPGDQRERIIEARDISRTVLNHYPREWLLLLEIFELCTTQLSLQPHAHPWLNAIKKQLNPKSPSYQGNQGDLIIHGMLAMDAN